MRFFPFEHALSPSRPPTSVSTLVVRSSGFTLLEVVVGLVLMAGLLVGSLLAFASHRRQLRTAEDKRRAVMLADQWLAERFGSQEGIPIAGRGPLPGQPGWIWETSLIGSRNLLQTPVGIIRLSVFDVRDARSPRRLVSVDVVEQLP